MRGRCVTEQLDAQTTLADLLETHLDGSSERRAVWRCLDRWPAAQGGYDYRMAVACAEEEIKADRAARP